MQFDKNKPIYIQIEDFIQEKIMYKIWEIDKRIPSVRELAESLEVNPNTVMRSYELLERDEIIYNQRGVGYFVDSKAIEIIKSKQTILFYDQLYSMFQRMSALDIDISDIQQQWTEFSKKN